jgi:ribosomal protein S18 acetylase RimI-like enzyme
MSNVAYFKRFRMEVDLGEIPPVPSLPAGYHWLGWNEDRLDQHAEVKFRSFIDEIDAIVFTSLSSPEGCLNLMREIRHKPGFRPEATWLIAQGDELCGTVQGVSQRSGVGAIQNLGVTALHRGRGLGVALLLRALHGFARAGLGRGLLEVTAQNDSAVRLYRRVGFRGKKTLYKAVDVGSSLQPASSLDVFVGG